MTATDPQARARAALGRYRVMAYVTGTMLLVLCLEMVLKYVFHAGGVEVATDGTEHALPVLGSWVAMVHGWIYVIYLVTVLMLWSAMRWGMGTLVVMVLGGVVPVMSFVVERRVHAAAEAQFGAVDGRDQHLGLVP